MEHRDVTVAPKTIPLDATAFDKRSFTTLWWLAGGGFLMNSRGTVVMLDPVISTSPDDETRCETGLPLVTRYPIKPADVPRADAILYTHSDDDHLGPISAKLLASKLHTLNIGPAPVFEKLVRSGVNCEEIVLCRPGDTFTLNNVVVEAVDADHPHQLIDSYFGAKGPVRPFRPGDCCGYIVQTHDGNFLFTGDTRLMEFHLKLKGIDVLALDVSICPYHLSTYGATVLANALQDAFLLPYHYGTFNEPRIPGYNGKPEDVLPRVENAGNRARILAPGQPFSLLDGKELK